MRDREEFDRFITESEGALLRFAGRYLHCRESARDAVQDALVKYIKYEQGPPPRTVENPLAWLFTATRNICLDILRSSRRKLEVSLDPEAYPEPADESRPSPDCEAFESDDAEMLGALIRGLDNREREILMLKMAHGRSYREISEILGLSVSNVGFILHNAVKKMRKAYMSLHQEPSAKTAGGRNA